MAKGKRKRCKHVWRLLISENGRCVQWCSFCGAAKVGHRNPHGEFEWIYRWPERQNDDKG